MGATQPSLTAIYLMDGPPPKENPQNQDLRTQGNQNKRSYLGKT